jgi:hypothetical protein
MAAEFPYQRFAALRFDDYQQTARNEALTPNERSGFPEHYRQGAESAIIKDIVAKLPALTGERLMVADIGCGATPLTLAIGELCRTHGHELLLVDGAEVLAQLPNRPGVTKLASRFPELAANHEQLSGRYDAVIVYSVIQVTFLEGSTCPLCDALLGLLLPRRTGPDRGPPEPVAAPSVSGRRCRTRLSPRVHLDDEEPDLSWPALPAPEPDDAVVIGLLSRARAAGSHAWVMPQAPGLPMANRREDLVLEQP